MNVSILTACYNSLPFIDRLHRSLASQSFRNFEWICVDDFSQDGTIEHLKGLASPGQLGMKLYRLPQNTGGPVAWAVAVREALGDAIILLDHDDELLPDALEQVRDNWGLVADDENLCGLFFRILNPSTGEIIGKDLPAGTRFTHSWLHNKHPDISDGMYALKAADAKKHITIQSMEGIALAGVTLNEMSKEKKFLIPSGKPVRYYHRDNPESQTNRVRISRKMVYTYARHLDQADRYYLARLPYWFRHAISLLRFSLEVHGGTLYPLRYVRRASIKSLLFLLSPLGRLARSLRRKPMVVVIPVFPPGLAEGLGDLRSEKRPKA